MKALYNFGIFLFSVLVHIVAPFSQKASLWVRGRRKWVENAGGKITPGDRVVWVHCASLGEFEQGRPIIEAIKKEDPHYKIVLTFFSPSGYEVRKNYPGADIICYLPLDTPGNSSRLIKLVNPSKVIFIKYEFWNNYLTRLSKKNIPVYLVSGIFRRDQHFFSWYGSFFRKILKSFTWIFVQDQNSEELLSSIGIGNVTVAGDTRFDRVIEISKTAREIPVIESFRGDEKLFVAGSSWNRDEEIITEYINRYPGRMKWIFAPHEIDPSNIERLENLLKVKCTRFSNYDMNDHDSRVMIIDNIGILSSVYRYAYIAEVGGGFGKGIHNILEAACWSIPVLFGPNHLNFREATDLIQREGANSFRDFNQFQQIIENWLDDESEYKKAASAAIKYVTENSGATHQILSHIT